MKAIIVSAGQGKRLLPHTANKPKCLLTVLDEHTVLEMQLRALAHCGFTEACIMVGYGEDQVERCLSSLSIPGLEIHTQFNPFFDISDNLATVWLARPEMSEDAELRVARTSAAVAVVIAGYFGINPPGFVAQVVAFAFGLAASSFFPILVLGIFSKRTSKEGAIAGMLTGLIFTFSYIVFFKFISPELNNAAHWWFGISPEGIGVIGALLNFVIALTIGRLGTPPPQEVLELVDDLRIPTGAGIAHRH